MNPAVSVMKVRSAVWLVGASSVALAGASVARAQASVPAEPPAGAEARVAAAAPDARDTIVVTGIRKSLATSQAIKQDADTIVDAITAQDIGALPDRSVTESLQRVVGVSISHFAAVNDPDHISPEGQNVVIRGLPFVESQFNGRDAFTANKGRSISFQDIPPELLAEIQVFKNQTADQIEGGIAGNINLITRRPLDGRKDIYAFTADINYGDLSKKVGPDFSGLISKQWETSAGRFGILVGASYSRLFTRQDSSKVTSYLPRCDAGPGCTTGIGTPIAGLTPGTTYYIPTGSGISRQDYDRVRKGFSAAAEYESPSGDLRATAQFLRTDTTNKWSEHTLAVVEDTAQGQVVPVAGTTLTFDKNNVFTKGQLTVANGYRPTGVPPFGIQQQEITRGVSERATTDDYSAHVAWQPTERLKLDFDGQYTDSYSRDLDVGLYGSTWANELIDLTGGFPNTTLSAPPGARYTSLADPQSTFYRAAIDHEDNNRGREYALRADGQFDFSKDSFLRKVKFGVRYADRSQTVKSDGYNWGNLSEAWNGSGPVYASQIVPSGFGTYNFGNFLRGNPQGGQTIFGFLGNNALNYNQFIAGARAIQAITVAQGGFTGWNPLGQRGNIVPVAQGGDGFHQQGEISTNVEKTTAAYVRADFGSNFGDMKLDGNVGLRYVHTSTNSAGATQFPLANTFGYNIVGGLPDCSKPLTTVPAYNICQNTPAQQQALVAFANGSFLLNTRGQSYDDFLPSLNLRLRVDPTVQFRFAYSKAITRASFNDLYNYTQLGLYSPVTTTVNNPVIGFRADARGNPLLKPTKSDNFDLSGEWYFSPVGSLTLTGFYKRLTNVYAVSNGVTSDVGNGVQSNLGTGAPTGTVAFTNNGVTQNVTFFGVNNNNNVVNVKGVELAYQQQFNFLPSPADGLGFQGSYTYIDADRLAGQANPALAAAAGTPNVSLPFPGISRHNINAQLFYEKYGVSAHLSYSWRSAYLVTSQDVNFPSQPVYSGDTGSFDTSIFYAVTPWAKIGLEGKNITNASQKTYVQINAAGLQALRAAFLTDRTYVLSVRAAF